VSLLHASWINQDLWQSLNIYNVKTRSTRERERLKDLESYSILDTLSETDYDDITAIVAEICGTEISLISLIDDKRQWFKSHHGIDVTETPKDYAFCAHAINYSLFQMPGEMTDFMIIH
jgi:hypothetical protein